MSFDGYAAINSLMQTDVDLIILDMMMDGLDGSSTLEKADELLLRLHEDDEYLDLENSKIPVVIYSGLESRNIHVKETKYFRLIDVWQKPISYSQLFSKAENILMETRMP